MLDASITDALQVGGPASILLSMYIQNQGLRRAIGSLRKGVRSVSKRLTRHEALDERRFDELRNEMRRRAPTVYPPRDHERPRRPDR